ncbi:MAG: T9SS type A sorting domain-containing protein [Sphingobacteriales bacterium]|nr:MAG: T9SS type A sorting domain-containing protein [Sphingobacteriales bacterium]
MKVRFNYHGTTNSTWALDGMLTPGASLPISYTWSGPDLSGSTGVPVTATPTTTGINTYTISTTVGGCPGGNVQVNVTVNPLPTITSTGTVAPVCFSGTTQTSTLAYSASTHNPTTYRIDWSDAANTAGIPDQGNRTFTSSAGGGTINTIAVPGNLPAGTYSGVMTISNGNNCTTTLPISLTVNPLPSATIDGTTTVCQNATQPSVTFSGGAGTAPYIFTYSISNGTTTTMQTVTSSGNTVTVPQATVAAGTFTYTLVSVRDASSTTCLNTVSGQTATITVNPVTLITGQPTGTTSYCVNGTPSALSVAATGTGLTYQWFSNGTTNANTGGTAISDATNASYTPPTADEGTVYYYVVVSGTCGVVPSDPIPVTIAPALELTELSPLPKQCYGSSFTMTIAVRNRNAQTQFQWYKDGQAITGATNASYIINSITPADDGNYHVVIKGDAPCNSDLTSQLIPLSSYVQNFTEWTSSEETGVDPIEWHEEKNWTCGIPNLYRDALVPIITNNKYPYIDNAPDTGGKVRNLIIAGGGSNLRIDGVLKIAGNVTNNGKIDAYLNGTVSTGMIEFVSNLNYYGSSGGYPLNGNNPTALTVGGSATTGDTRTQHLKISNAVNFTIPVDVYGQLSFAGSNRRLGTGDSLTLKSVSSTVSAMITDRTNNGQATKDTIIGQVTVERFIDGAQGRKWRLLTAPVKGNTINKAWQEGMTMSNGSHVILGTSTTVTPATGIGTLITGGSSFGTPALASGAGFDYWDAIKNGLASIMEYSGNPDWKLALWSPVTTTKLSPFDAHKAYLLFVRGDRFQTSTTASNNTVLRPKGLLKEELKHQFTLHASNSHTLIGNPYASPLDFRKIYADNENDIQPYFWIWQASLTASWGGYAVIKPQTEGSTEYEMVPYNSGSGTKEEPVISSGQGFFVIPATNATSPAMTIHQTHKLDVNSKISVFREAGDKPKKIFVNVYAPAANVNQDILLDGALAEFTGEEKKTEIGKMLQSGENLSVFKNNRDLIVAVGSQPKIGEKIQLKLWNTGVKAYRFGIRTANLLLPGMAAILVDRFRNTETPLSPGDATTTYDFQLTGDPASRDPLRFYIMFQGNPLPAVTLQGLENRNGINLQWQVAEEVNVAKYDLEKSVDGTTFKPINSAGSGGSAGPQQYAYLDGQASMLAHYRVKLTGITGAVGYSNTVTVELQQPAGLTIFPNPVVGRTVKLLFTTKPEGKYNIVVFSPAGQRVASQVIHHRGGTATYELTVSNVASGTYTVEINQKGGRKEKIKLVITH